MMATERDDFCFTCISFLASLHIWDMDTFSLLQRCAWWVYHYTEQFFWRVRALRCLGDVFTCNLSRFVKRTCVEALQLS